MENNEDSCCPWVRTKIVRMTVVSVTPPGWSTLCTAPHMRLEYTMHCSTHEILHIFRTASEISQFYPFTTAGGDSGHGTSTTKSSVLSKNDALKAKEKNSYLSLHVMQSLLPSA